MDRAWTPAPASGGSGITDSRGGHLTLTVRPHLEERNGCRFHLDRFDAYLDGELILTSRQPWHGAARELLHRGYPRGTLLTMRHAGKDYDCFVPLEIGYLAERSISESDRGGLKRIQWQPMPEHLKQRGRLLSPEDGRPSDECLGTTKLAMVGERATSELDSGVAGMGLLHAQSC